MIITKHVLKRCISLAEERFTDNISKDDIIRKLKVIGIKYGLQDSNQDKLIEDAISYFIILASIKQ